MTPRKRIFHNPARVLAAAAAALVAAACSDSTTNTSSPEVSAAISSYTAEQFQATAKPKFTTDGGATPFRTSKTIPYWSSSFTDPTNRVTYPYTMVGTNAFTSTAQTTVPTVIIPFRFVFANGIVMDGGGDVAATIASPIFADYTYPLSNNDFTQYGDAIQRAQFNRLGSNYHVRLGAPTVLPTQTIEVPANQGVAFPISSTDFVGLMDIGWFANKLHNAINALHVSPQTVPIVLTAIPSCFAATNAACWGSTAPPRRSTATAPSRSRPTCTRLSSRPIRSAASISRAPAWATSTRSATRSRSGTTIPSSTTW